MPEITASESAINLAEFICESDWIENIYDEPRVLIKQIESRKKDGHVGAMLMLEGLVRLSCNVPGYVTKEVICKIQGLITAEQQRKRNVPRLLPKHVGQYRDCWVGVKGGKYFFPDPEVVPALMNSLIDRIVWWQDNSRFQAWDQNVRAIARFHLDFEAVHPFADGNGRTGRALVYYLMRWAMLKPFIFTSMDKSELYYPCFIDPANVRPMEEYFFTKMGCPEIART